jgi:hypothetical protein
LALKVIADVLGARVQTSLFLGSAAHSPEATLNEKDRAEAYQAGRRLADSLV